MRDRRSILAKTLIMASLAAGGHGLAARPACAWAEQPEEAALESDHAIRLFFEDVWPDARASGVSRRTFERALAVVHVDWSILERANYQPEHEFAIGDYLARLASDARVQAGRSLLSQHAATFAGVEQAYGVDRHMLAAIWGIESNFGAGMGDYGVISALGMLAWKGERRAAFGRQQLIAALRILERGDIEPARMLGSWAGAMGHTQFIPTTYSLHAVDFDRDGRRDIWGTISDALASTANYLKVSGWRTGLPWGFEVVVPDGFDDALLDRDLPMSEWARRGIERPAPTSAATEVEPSSGQTDERWGPGPDRNSAGTPVSSPTWSAVTAVLRLPAGSTGPAFLVTGNFRAILRYNNATSYALAVGRLADRLAGAGPLVRPWPADDRPLRRREREELQELLRTRGYYRGEVDGLLGDQSKAALIAWQRHAGVVADGYASERMLQRLRGEPGGDAGRRPTVP